MIKMKEINRRRDSIKKEFKRIDELKGEKSELKIWMIFSWLVVGLIFIVITLVDPNGQIKNLEQELQECQGEKIVMYYDYPETLCEYYNGTYGFKETWIKYGRCFFPEIVINPDFYDKDLENGYCKIDKKEDRWFFIEGCQIIK